MSFTNTFGPSGYHWKSVINICDSRMKRWVCFFWITISFRFLKNNFSSLFSTVFEVISSNVVWNDIWEFGKEFFTEVCSTYCMTAKKYSLSSVHLTSLQNTAGKFLLNPVKYEHFFVFPNLRMLDRRATTGALWLFRAFSHYFTKIYE